MSTDDSTKPADTADFAPFTDSILRDIGELPPDVRWELLGEWRERFGPARRVDWSTVAGMVVLPLLVLLAYNVFATDLSGFGRGLLLGIAAMLTLDALGAVIGAIERQVAIWRITRADARRESRS